ncbi:MAG: hypothetical protein EBV44_05925 [Synechococcaceae bacterium WB7_1B_046]|nr:hypothetical protein [Synechococcaceae bacterium WB7_1B_046]
MAKLITLDNNRRLALLGLCFNLLAFIACAFAIQLAITKLLTTVPYGIVRTVLLPGNRFLCASLSGLFLSVGVVLIIYWSLALRHE